ncbi:MAG TPA: heme biosynthesis HemY N-terminal domain-containing protein [Xanthomonadales bacterium]|nr:heme biosynthesis HemY N-terminal domain-containing protein [Xanthomonadales bacterium]
MRNVFLLLITLALVLLAAALAPVFLNDPGVVQIRFRGWTLEMSVLVLVLGVLLAWVILYFVVRIWRLPTETARKVREQRALKQLEKGLLALTEGDWTTAERALQKSTSSEGQTTARYLAAAQAADGQQAGDRAEWYLEQAESGGRKNRFLVDLTRARLLTENGRFEEAVPVLEELRRRRKRHSQVLELLSRCYRAMGRWQSMQEILPVMQKAGLIDEKRAEALKNQAAEAQIAQSKDLEQLKATWNAFPRPMQKSSGIVLAFAEKAARLGGSELTESVLRASLKKEWDSALLIPYGDPGANDASQRLKQCEKWMVDHPEDARLHLALGRLCAREELWGKARHHMIRSLELEPTVAGYDWLGQLLERQGELEMAMACFRNALRMNMGEKPLPLPSEHIKLNAPPDS